MGTFKLIAFINRFRDVLNARFFCSFQRFVGAYFYSLGGLGFYLEQTEGQKLDIGLMLRVAGL